MPLRQRQAALPPLSKYESNRPRSGEIEQHPAAGCLGESRTPFADMLNSNPKHSTLPVRAILLALAATALLLLPWPPLHTPRTQQSRTPPRAPYSLPDEAPAYSPPSPAKSVEIGNFYLKRKNYRGALS